MSQDQRELIMSNFRTGKSRVLIATDIWGRGLDVQQVALVVNYDLPLSKELYLHRIGRSGRFGRKGIAINLINNQDMQELLQIQKFYAIKINEMPATITL